MEGEVVLLGFDVEVVVADTVSLVEDDAGETRQKDHHYAYSKKAEAHDLEYIAFRLKAICEFHSGQVTDHTDPAWETSCSNNRLCTLRNDDSDTNNALCIT